MKNIESHRRTQTKEGFKRDSQSELGMTVHTFVILAEAGNSKIEIK